MKNLILDEVSFPEDLKILVIEDTPFFQKKMLSSLSDIGFVGKITLAETISAALLKVTREKPQFILSDWNLPDGNGLDFLKQLRSLEVYEDVPFIMVTTMDEIDNILEAIEFGADGYIVKPWIEKDLIEKMAFAYKKKNKL